MATNERRDELLLSVDNLLQVRKDWMAEADVRFITEQFELSVDAVLILFAEGGIPGDLRAMNELVVILASRWQEWCQKNENSGGKFPIPDNAFWKAVDAIAASRQVLLTPKKQTVESIADLTSQRVPDANICRIYGFTDTGTPFGNPITAMLREERANPGTHTGEGWLPPWARKDKEDEAKREKAIEEVKRMQAGKLRLLTQIAKESIEDLVGQGVCGRQICRMKKIDESELNAYCDEHHVPLPEWEAEAANLTTGVHDAGQDEEETIVEESVAKVPDLNPDGSMTLEQEIIEYHKLGGLGADEIAAAVTSEDAPVSRQKVAAVIKRYKEDPAAFETADVE